uniref:Protein BCCIP homolog n=1 Tax=Chenopodium quinoa TaxID=63459 RepID=A0A803LA71_CHEQI
MCRYKGMPRKPRRSGQLVPRPFAFSSFARSVTRVATACSSKNKVSNSKSDRTSSKLIANRSSRKHNLKENSSESESSEEEEAPEEVIQADFAFFDPKPDDFHGVKMLLQSYLDDKVWDLSGFVDLILAQTTVGSVVKIEDDEDEGLFALLTALNLGRYKDNKCITDVRDYLLKVCEEKNVVGDLKRLLGDQADHVGLVVSQRVTNLPPQLLPHLYNALFDEISWATEDEQKIGQKRKASSSSDDEDIIYVKPEDELLFELCSWSFTFPLHIQPPASQELKNYRLMGLVMAVEADKAPAFREKLRSLIDDS